MVIYFTADTHFQHANIIKFGRGAGLFNSINHHDKILRDRWTSIITDEDTVYVLGDIALGDLTESLLNFSYLPGKKLLVPGNHDRLFSGTNSKTHIAKWKDAYEEVGFEILPENTSIFIDTAYGKQEVLLSHFPYQQTAYENAAKDKFLKNRPVNTGLPLIHGHTHSLERFNPENPLEFHVGVDANDFTPVHIQEVVTWLELLKPSSSIGKSSRSYSSS